MRPAIALAGALMLLTCPAATRAQGSDAAAQDDDLARQYFKLGEKLYQRADYRGALEQFELSYRHSGRAALLHNIARCQEALGKHCDAADTYKRYLESGPPNADLVGARVENLTRLCEESRRPAPADRPVPADRPAPTDKPAPADRPAPTDRPVPPDKPVTPDPVAPAPSSPRPGGGLRVAGWALAGAGVAALVTGGVLGGLARGRASTVEDAAANGEYESVAGDYDAGKSLSTGAVVGFAVGGAAVAAGAVLLYLGYTRGAERPARAAWVAPAVAPGGAVVSGGISF